MTQQYETRFESINSAELRCESELGQESRMIYGIAHRYGSISVPMRDAKGRTFREMFRPGAFAKSLAAGSDVRFLVNHDPNLILARNRSGTLRITDDSESLRFEAELPPTDLARHYATQVSRQDISGCSFRFVAIRDVWTAGPGGLTREVIEAEIDDISIVTYAAYQDTEAAARSLDAHVAAAAKAQQERDRRRAVEVDRRVRIRLALAKCK